MKGFSKVLTSIIRPKMKGCAAWFYSLPAHDQPTKPATRLYNDYVGAVKYGNIFSANIGPDHAGKIRSEDVKTLTEVGEMIKINE